MIKQKVIAIMAMDDEWGISKDGKIPWNIPTEMAHFRDTTMGYPVIMGSSTFKTLGRPLPGRINIVLTKKHYCVEGCLRAANPQHALDLAVMGQHDKVFIIGGEQVYREYLQHLDVVDELMISKIEGKFGCDKKLWDFKCDGFFNFISGYVTKPGFKVENYERKNTNLRLTKFQKKNFLIDIDGTICEDIPNEEPEKFATAKLIDNRFDHQLKCVENLKLLREAGHDITFFTSRKKEHEEVTVKWLKEHDFVYDKIIFDKPRYGKYIWIDNLNVTGLITPDGGMPAFFPAG